MGILSKIFGKNDDDYECQRMVKYDGTSVSVSGVNFSNFQLGGATIEKKLIQAATHAIMLLDYSQYDLCTSIRNIGDKVERDKLTKTMIEEKLRMQKIIQALAALSMDPSSNRLQSILQNLLTSDEKLTTQLEKPDQNSKPVIEPVTESSLQLDTTPITEKISEIKSLDIPEQKRSQNVQVPEISLEEKPNENSTVDAIGLSIYSLRQEFTDTLTGKQEIQTFSKRLISYLVELTNKPENKNLFGSRYTRTLTHYLANLSSEQDGFTRSSQMGDSAKEELSKRKIIVVSTEILDELDNMYSELKSNKTV